MFDQFPNKPIDHNFVGFAPVNQNHGDYRHRFAGGGVQFRLETMAEDEASGVCSPPLWQNTDSPRLLSPSSRAQAIARGQREIMEMVEKMPETSYELSLKDIVEQRRDFDETESMEEGEERSILGGSQRWKKSVRRQESGKKGRIMVKNESLNHNKGLLINMFFPFSLGSKKTKRRGSSSFSKSELLDTPPKYGGDGGVRDWWWKRFTGSSDGESVGITSSSGGESTGRSGSSGSSTSGGSVRSNSVRKSNGCSHGCWSFFPSITRKRKS